MENKESTNKVILLGFDGTLKDKIKQFLEKYKHFKSNLTPSGDYAGETNISNCRICLYYDRTDDRKITYKIQDNDLRYGYVPIMSTDPVLVTWGVDHLLNIAPSYYGSTHKVLDRIVDKDKLSGHLIKAPLSDDELDKILSVMVGHTTNKSERTKHNITIIDKPCDRRDYVTKILTTMGYQVTPIDTIKEGEEYLKKI